jgi:hypothetical protein
MVVFIWSRPGFELVKVDFVWNVQVPILQSANGNDDILESPFFSSQDTPGQQWKLALFGNSKLHIQPVHYDSAGQAKTIVDPVLVMISIVNQRGQKLHQQINPSEPNSYYVLFELSKEEILKSECQQVDGSYTFYCEILSHVKKELGSPVNPPGVELISGDGLSTQLEKCILR